MYIVIGCQTGCLVLIKKISIVSHCLIPSKFGSDIEGKTSFLYFVDFYQWNACTIQNIYN